MVTESVHPLVILEISTRGFFHGSCFAQRLQEFNRPRVTFIARHAFRRADMLLKTLEKLKKKDKTVLNMDSTGSKEKPTEHGVGTEVSRIQWLLGEGDMELASEQ